MPPRKSVKPKTNQIYRMKPIAGKKKAVQGLARKSKGHLSRHSNSKMWLVTLPADKDTFDRFNDSLFRLRVDGR